MTWSVTLPAWRPFDSAQDMLGAINFPGVVLSNISKVSIYAYNLAQPTECDSARVTHPDSAHVAIRPELSR